MRAPTVVTRAGHVRAVPLRIMTLALTSQCNLRCRYCYLNAKSGAQMPWSVVRASAERLLESTSDCVDLVFAGGEPLLTFDLIERAVRYIESRRPARTSVQYTLATNGTLLGPDTIAFLDRHRFDIALSFDGVPPAQAVRGKRSFAQIDVALDRLRDNAPATFRHRLTVGVTLDADAVPHLSESFAYFLDKGLPSISIWPATGQSARWTPRVLEQLERELTSISRMARRHYTDTGEVPLVMFRKTSNDPPARRDMVCGAAGSVTVTVDVDGETYACPMLAESSRRVANPRLAPLVRPMRTGQVADPAFWQRMARRSARARASGIFQIGPCRHSLHGWCIRCPYRLECTACPLAALEEPGHDDGQRVPDYFCAFSWTVLGLRRRFPVQPDAAARLAGRARKPRLVRELLDVVGA